MTRSSAEPRKKPRQERSRVTVDAVLQAAAMVLESDGQHGLSTTRVAQVAGVSVGSLYQYYPNKAAIVAALCEKFITDDFQLFAEMTTAARGVPLSTSVPALLRGMLTVYRTNARARGALFDQMAVVGRTPFLHAMLQRYVEQVRQFLVSQQAGLQVTVTDTMAFVILHAVEGVLRAAALDPPEPLDEDALLAVLEGMVFGFLGVTRADEPG